MGIPFNYELSDLDLRVKLGSFVIRRIAYSDMMDISGYSFVNEHWTNIWPHPFRFVTIRRKSGFFKNFLITPDNRDQFIADLRARLAAGGPS